MGRSVTAYLLYGFDLGEAHWDYEDPMDWISKDEDGYCDGVFVEDIEDALEQRVAGFTEPYPEPYTAEAAEGWYARRKAAVDGLGLHVVTLGWTEAESLYALVAKKITDSNPEDPFKTMLEFDYAAADSKLWGAVSILHIPVGDQVPHWWLDYSIG